MLRRHGNSRAQVPGAKRGLGSKDDEAVAPFRVVREAEAEGVAFAAMERGGARRLMR